MKDNVWGIFAWRQMESKTVLTLSCLEELEGLWLLVEWIKLNIKFYPLYNVLRILIYGKLLLLPSHFTHWISRMVSWPWCCYLCCSHKEKDYKKIFVGMHTSWTCKNKHFCPMLNTQYFGVSNGAFQLGSIGPNWYAPFGNLIFFFFLFLKKVLGLF